MGETTTRTARWGVRPSRLRPARRALLADARSAAVAWYRLVRGSDLALVYGGIVAVVAIVLALCSASTRNAVIADSSTNLVNLRDHPLLVLFVSAFVVSSLAALWQLFILLPLFAAAQRWVGRAGAIVVALIGHVGATLFVATLINAGIFHRYLASSLARASDVGVSYGMASLAGFLIGQVPARWRWWYLAGVLLYFVAPIVVVPSFTSVGHITALTLGLALALLAHRVARSALARPPASPSS